MEAVIQKIATSAGWVVLNPFVLAVAVLTVLALMTGLAARGAILLEDFLQSRR